MPDNVLNATWPEALKSVYEIKTSDPVEGGPDGIDNKPHKDLERRTDYLLQEIARVAGLVPGTSEYEALIEYLKTLDVSIVTSRVDYIRTLLRALGLYTDSKFWFEFFERPEAEADLFDTAVEEAHAGSDCIDLVDTAGVKAGKEYYLYDDNHAETVVVLEVLDAERFRTVEPIHHTYSSSARLVRTKWSFKPTEGVALPGTWYYSKEMQLGYSADKTLIVRRQDNAGILRVYSRGGGQTWKEIPWEWRRDVGEIGGMPFVDVEYPIRGNEGLEIKILCEGEEIVIHWMAAVAGKTNLRGTHNGPYQPANVWPMDGATDALETPTLEADVYRHPAGTAQKTLEVRISESPEFGELVHYATGLPAGTSYAVPAGVLKENKTYYFGFRYGDEEDAFSPWSDATSFHTAAVFLYVKTPAIIAPANGETGVSSSLTLECSAFGIFGATDSHAATRWQIREASASWSEPVFDERSTTDKTRISVPAGLLMDGRTTYYVRCLHESGSHGNSEWSSESRFETKELFAKIFGAAVISKSYIHHVDVKGNFISPAKSDFDAHAAWGGMVDVVSDGQAMVKIPKFYIKRGNGPAGSDSEGKDCWWISDQPYPGFKVFPAFKMGSIELDYFLIGKYSACISDAGVKLGSLSGQALAQSLTLDVAKTMARARGTGWHAWDMQELAAIQWLFLVEHASFDCRAVISQGNKTGKFPHSGFLTGTTDVIYRGIHELWGVNRQLIDGIGMSESATGIWLFSEDGNRTTVETMTRMKGSNLYTSSFRKDNLFENLFIQDDGVSVAGNALCPDTQSMSSAAGATVAIGDIKEASLTGLWHMMSGASHPYVGSRIAKR